MPHVILIAEKDQIAAALRDRLFEVFRDSEAGGISMQTQGKFGEALSDRDRVIRRRVIAHDHFVWRPRLCRETVELLAQERCPIPSAEGN